MTSAPCRELRAGVAQAQRRARHADRKGPVAVCARSFAAVLRERMGDLVPP